MLFTPSSTALRITPSAKVNMESASTTTATITCPVKKTSPEEQKNAAYTALSTGKRHLLVSDVALAVSSLAEACKLLANLFGETASECGEAYYYYGKSLLEMSRLESRVLGNALEGVDMDSEDAKDSEQVEDTEKMTADEKTDVEEKVAEALDENFEAHDKLAKIHSVEDVELESADDSQDSAMEEESPVKKVNGIANGDVKPEAEAAGKAMEEDKEAPKEDEEPSNLQLAWEMLELSKVIYTKTVEASSDAELKKELEQKICESYLVLGEVSLENENYAQAVEDFTTCLNKRKANLPADSRSIAETHYQLGVSLAFHSKYTEAETSLNSAIEVLQARIANLKKMESSENIAKEVTDLEALVTEIKEKIADHKDMEKETQTVKVDKEPGFSGSGDGKAISSIDIKRKDLSEAKPVGTPTTPSA